MAFDALGSFACAPTDAACLASPAASHRQIFMYNLLSTELRQITNSALGDSVQPSFNKTGGMMVFQSTAPLTGFPNPTGVPQVFVVKLNFVGNPQLPGPVFKQLSVGPSPANVIGLGPSINPILNENGTGVAFQSRSDFLGGGGDTGIYQIYYVDFDKDDFTGPLIRVTNGNASSEHPHLGFTKVPDPQPGADNKRKVLLFDSAATNLPGAQAGGGGVRKIYEVSISGLSDDNGTPDKTSCGPNVPPNTACVHNITTTIFGNCTHPVVDPSGARLGFTCDGNPLNNNSTGNQAFAMTRQSAQLFQLTGAGEVVGPISNSIGQWFMTLATTSDLTRRRLLRHAALRRGLHGREVGRRHRHRPAAAGRRPAGTDDPSSASATSRSCRAARRRAAATPPSRHATAPRPRRSRPRRARSIRATSA